MSVLIDSQTNCYLWSEFTERKLEDLLWVHEGVAQPIMQRLQAEISRAGAARASRPRTESLAAHSLYQQSRFHLDHRTEQGLMKAAEFFDKAIREDPRYDLPYSGSSDAHGLLGHYSVLAPSEICTRAASNAAWAGFA